MSDARRTQDDEPLTELEAGIDTKHLDSLEGEVSTSPGVTTSPGTAPGTLPDGADGEPQTMEPPRKMGVPRLRANTIMGVAPPSSVVKGPPSASPSSAASDSDAMVIPKIQHEGEDEQTTLVGKLLAEAHLEVRNRLKERAEERDLYQDETATTVGDADKLIAMANAAALAKGGDDSEEETENAPAATAPPKDSQIEDTTSKRDAINIDETLARAAELRAEAEARKKRAAKKQTIHGLGTGPLTLPARPKPDDDELPTSQNRVDLGERASPMTPADGEPETLSVGSPMAAPMHSIATEPETMPVQVPAPPSPRERQMTSPVHGSVLLSGQTGANVNVAQTMVSQSSSVGAPMPAPMPAPMTQAVPSHAGPYTQPMPLAPTVRMDDPAHQDPALRETMNGALTHPSSSNHRLPNTPPGGIPHYPSPAMPMPAMMGMPHSGPAAFARTAVATGSTSGVSDDTQKKGGRGGLIAFLLLLAVAGGAGYWKRALLIDTWHRYRHPPPIATAAAEPAPSTAPSTAASTTAAASPTAPPPVATDTAPSASPPASAATAPSSSAAPVASASASASASSSASAKTNAKKPPSSKPAPWRPPPKKPTPKPAPDNGGAYGF